MTGNWADTNWDNIEQSDAYVMKSFKSSSYWYLFRKYIEKELEAVESVAWTPWQKIDSEMVSKMELLRYQRIFIKWLLDLPEKIISMDITKELSEQNDINERELKKLM